MRRVPSDSETAARCNGNSIHSILKETHRIPSISESSRNRHLSNESCGSIKGVTFDKSLPTNAFRNDRDVSSQSLRNRRTSLPVNTSLHPRLRDQGNVSEARGLIMDMLQNRDLQPQVISCLRAVASLLTPQMSVQNGNFMDFLPKVVENPYSGEQLMVSSVSFVSYIRLAFLPSRVRVNPLGFPWPVFWKVIREADFQIWFFM